MVVISMDGATLWAALESALSTWPAQEGYVSHTLYPRCDIFACLMIIVLRHNSRFPILSGFRAEWDSRKPPGQRVLGIWAEKITDVSSRDSDFKLPESESESPVRRNDRQNGEPVPREPGGKKYVVVTREYMANGHDGFEALKGCEYVGGVDEEHGMLMSAIARKYILGESCFFFFLEHFPAPPSYAAHNIRAQGRNISIAWRDWRPSGQPERM